jgi:hypothetical protein
MPLETDVIDGGGEIDHRRAIQRVALVGAVEPQRRDRA